MTEVERQRRVHADDGVREAQPGDALALPMHALALMERIGAEGWCLCVSASAQADVEKSLRELITYARSAESRAADAIASLDQRWEHSDHLAAKYYRKMRAAEREMNARELHHFEEEQRAAKLEAAIREALDGGDQEPGGFVMTETPRRILSAALGDDVPAR